MIVAALGGIGLLGCDDPRATDKADAYPVEGRVTFEDQEPVPDVLVSFSSLDGMANTNARTDEQGWYHTRTGIPAGEYRVVVGPPLDSTLPVPFDPRYSNKKTSGLTASIEPHTNRYDIEVERAHPKETHSE